jgi:hypothetical protein
MTEEEYIRMKNMLDAVIEQQAAFAESQAKADERNAKTDERIARNAEGIAALLTLAGTARARDNQNKQRDGRAVQEDR